MSLEKQKPRQGQIASRMQKYVIPVSDTVPPTWFILTASVPPLYLKREWENKQTIAT